MIDLFMYLYLFTYCVSCGPVCNRM